MVDVRKFEEPAQLIANWEEYSEGDAYSIVYVTGGSDPVTGKNWCPDCTEAKPFVDAVIYQAKCPVFVGYVMDRNTWVGVGSHPYKMHSVFKAKGVPTLMLF